MSGMRKAIDDKCKECIYDSFQPGTWRQQTEDCVSVTCPLYSNRPLTAETTRKNTEGSARSDKARELYQKRGKIGK